MSLYPQKPLSIGQVLDRGFAMYRAIFKPMLFTSMVLGLLAQLPALVQHGMIFIVGAGASPGALIGITVLVFALIWFGVYMAMYNGWVMSLDAVARGGQPYGVGQTISAGLPKMLTMVIATILFVLALLIGMLLLLIPGFILMGSLLFFYFFILLENQGAVAALKSSHRLVWGHWWRTVTIMTVAGLLYFVAVFIVMLIGGAALGLSAVGATSPEDAKGGIAASMLVFALVQAALNGLLMPLFTSIALVTFRDLQLRKSGADLVARAAAA
jgi:hypothetical protein